MIKVNYLESLINTYEMLKNLDNQEVCLKDIKTLKKEYKASNGKTSTIETLKRIGVLSKVREEDVTIILKKPTDIKEVLINGQKAIGNITCFDIEHLKNLGLKVEVIEKTTTELQVKKCYYKVCLTNLTKKINLIKKQNKIYIKWNIEKMEKKLEIYKKLLTLSQ